MRFCGRSSSSAISRSSTSWLTGQIVFHVATEILYFSRAYIVSRKEGFPFLQMGTCTSVPTSHSWKIQLLRENLAVIDLIIGQSLLPQMFALVEVYFEGGMLGVFRFFKAFRTLFWIVFLIVLAIYVCSIFFTRMIGHNREESASSQSNSWQPWLNIRNTSIIDTSY